MRLNICFVVISDGWGGAETVVYELARCLKDRGEKVSIILNQEIIGFYESLQGIEFLNIGNVYDHKTLIKETLLAKPRICRRVKMSVFPWTFCDEILRPVYFRRLRRQIKRFLIDKTVDIIHSHLGNADILVSLLGKIDIPKVSTIHGPYFSMPEGNSVFPIMLQKKWRMKTIKNSLLKMNKIIFVSHQLFNAYKDFLPVEDKGKVIPNGIDLFEFQKELIPNYKLKGEFNLLFPGGAKPSKGGDILIEALSRVREKIPGIHLYIALEVPLAHPLRKKLKELGLINNVTFLGFLEKEKYKEYLNSVDMLILPSLAEGFPLVNLEAMALGKAIIASNRGDIPDYVKNGRNGIIIEPKSDQIYEAILNMYNDENLRKEVAKNNIEDVKKFSWESRIDAYTNVYRSLLSLEKC